MSKQMIKVKISSEIYDEVIHRMGGEPFSDACKEFIDIVWDAKTPTKRKPTIIEVSIDQFDAFVKEIANAIIELWSDEMIGLNADVWYGKNGIAALGRYCDRIRKMIVEVEEVK